MDKPAGKYTAAQEELSRVMIKQKTIGVQKLSRLLNTMNISLQPGKSSENVEIAYLKNEIKKRNKTIMKMSEKIKRLNEEKMHQ